MGTRKRRRKIKKTLKVKKKTKPSQKQKNLQSTEETRLNQKIQLKRNQNLRQIVRRAKKRPQVMKNRSILSCDKLECYYLKFYLQHCTPFTPLLLLGSLSLNQEASR